MRIPAGLRAVGVRFEPTRHVSAPNGFQDRLGLTQRCAFRPFRARKCASRALEVGVDERDCLVAAAGEQVPIPVECDADARVPEEGRERLRVHAGLTR
jgi:hypothetical protein